MSIQTPQKSTRNFGVGTEISKGINEALGDTSGRTVSRRTAHGLKKILDKPEMHDDVAEDIVHGGMIGALLILLSGGQRRNNFMLGLLVFLLIVLFIFYHIGKNYKT